MKFIFKCIRELYTAYKYGVNTIVYLKAQPVNHSSESQLSDIHYGYV